MFARAVAIRGSPGQLPDGVHFAAAVLTISTPSPRPPTTVSCTPSVDPQWPAFASDSCPQAVDAVRALFSSPDLVITRIYLDPGAFACGIFWPGAISPKIVCLGVIQISATAMHGWVTLYGTDRVAAVGLSRPWPDPGNGATPDPSASLWQASIAAFVVPPTGFVML